MRAPVPSERAQTVLSAVGLGGQLVLGVGLSPPRSPGFDMLDVATLAWVPEFDDRSGHPPHAVFEGIERVWITAVVRREPVLEVLVEPIDDLDGDHDALGALLPAMRRLLPRYPDRELEFLLDPPPRSLGEAADRMTSLASIEADARLDLLLCPVGFQRFDWVVEALVRRRREPTALRG